MRTPIAVTIAGSDSGGGAGIQADLKTFSALGVYGASVIAALTAQNTKSVADIHEVPPAFVAAQIDAVFGDGQRRLTVVDEAEVCSGRDEEVISEEAAALRDLLRTVV